MGFRKGSFHRRLPVAVGTTNRGNSRATSLHVALLFLGGLFVGSLHAKLAQGIVYYMDLHSLRN
jgi:hypothetical protein